MWKDAFVYILVVEKNVFFYVEFLTLVAEYGEMYELTKQHSHDFSF